MPYQRSLDFERRLEAVLELIRSGQFCTPRIAEFVGVSIPMVSREVTALRDRGYDTTGRGAANLALPGPQ
jgi:Mn-dependent DtxR family transcriptional regulator